MSTTPKQTTEGKSATSVAEETSSTSPVSQTEDKSTPSAWEKVAPYVGEVVGVVVFDGKTISDTIDGKIPTPPSGEWLSKPLNRSQAGSTNATAGSTTAGSSAFQPSAQGEGSRVSSRRGKKNTGSSARDD